MFDRAFRWVPGPVLVAMAIFGGCDGGTTPESACARYAAGGCKYSFTCTSYAAAFYGSETDCRDALEDICQHVFIARGTAGPDQLAACGDALASGSCGTSVSTPEACNVQGTLDAGAPCSSSLQCKSGKCANIVDECGTCTTPLAEGDPCNPLDTSSCGAQLACSMSTSKCARRAAVGEACTDVPCQPLVACVNGTCAAPAGKGQPCDNGCDLRLGLTCNAVTGVCEDYVVAALGEPCGTDQTTGKSSLCKYDARCDGAVCVAAKSEGEPCAAASECRVPFSCQGGTCTVEATKECSQPM